MPGECGSIDERSASDLPFGYYLDRESQKLTLRRSDGSIVAAFSASGVDIFEVEATVWENADKPPAVPGPSLGTQPGGIRKTTAIRKPVPLHWGQRWGKGRRIGAPVLVF